MRTKEYYRKCITEFVNVVNLASFDSSLGCECLAISGGKVLQFHGKSVETYRKSIANPMELAWGPNIYLETGGEGGQGRK